MVIALALIVLGLFFFARALGFIGDEALNIVWPLLLVVVGLAMLAHRGDEKAWWDAAVKEISGGKKKRKRKKK